MATLFEIIETFEARRHHPAPASQRAVLTPRGEAAVAIIRLKRQLAALTADDRDELLPLLADLVAAVANHETVAAGA